MAIRGTRLLKKCNTSSLKWPFSLQAAQTVFSTYDIDNALIDGYDVVVNKPKTAAYRAPGAPNAAFGVKTIFEPKNNSNPNPA